MKIGIGITTRNRPELLAYALKHFLTFPTFHKSIIVVSDDDSDEAPKIPEEVHLLTSNTRLGIAKNKNKCVDYLRSQGVDHYFLFDDDCFPIKYAWDLPFIALSATDNIHHSLYLVAAGEVSVKETHEHYLSYYNCGGYCLFFTKHAMDLLQGMNPEFGIYGFEHSELSKRAFDKGLTGLNQFNAPIRASEYLFSLDMDSGWLHKESPLGPFTGVFTSSVERERPLIAGYIEENRKVYEKIVLGK
jgi:glycosyltransferase involved in cell wall biosynthesis